jgi:hypothetical protein
MGKDTKLKPGALGWGAARDAAKAATERNKQIADIERELFATDGERISQPGNRIGGQDKLKRK